MADSGREDERATYWNTVYSRRGETGVSWFESLPSQSLELLDILRVAPEHSLIDVGAGAARLVDAVVARGFTDVTALDVSDEGLELSRCRLGVAAERVRWIVTDVLTWRPDRQFDVWHDRAVFHFLTDPPDRARYLDTLRRVLVSGGHALLATFAEDGPQRCSGLDVSRYSPDELAETLGEDFEPVTARRIAHRTPTGAVQPFTWLAVRRKTRSVPIHLIDHR